MPLIASRATASSRAYGFGRGATPFSGTISSNQTNLNLRTWALANGWDGLGAVTVTINAGVVVYSTTTAGYALTISGSFPGGVSLVNNGVILGAGGGGGSAGSGTGAGSAGQAGGPAMVVSTAVSITNNNRIAGGGGGGGGGGGYEDTSAKPPVSYSGGAGGGGIGNGPPNGTLTAAGAGASGAFGLGGTGGNGGTYGAAGASGGAYTGAGGAGGAAGACLSGNSFITWVALGTRNGTIT